MFHSMYIGDKNTWDDYSLVPFEKIYFPVAKQKTITTSIEGASGSLDFSTLLTGYPIYENITGSIRFYLLDSIDTRIYANAEHAFPANYSFYDIFAKIRGDLDGKTARVWLEDDPDWYYEGRVNVTTEMASPRPTVTLSYDLGPYKKARRAKKWELNGLGSSIINRQIIPEELAGPMPANFSFTVTSTSADIPAITFKCPALNIEDTRTFQPGTYTVYEWVIYKYSEILVNASSDVKVTVLYTPGRL